MKKLNIYALQTIAAIKDNLYRLNDIAENELGYLRWDTEEGSILDMQLGELWASIHSAQEKINNVLDEIEAGE